MWWCGCVYQWVLVGVCTLHCSEVQSTELLCLAIRHDLIFIVLLFIFVGFLIVYWRIIIVIVFLWFNFLDDRLFVPRGVWVNVFFRSWFYLPYFVYRGHWILLFIYFYFLILKELIVYVNYCFISINNRLLVVKCYLSTSEQCNIHTPTRTRWYTQPQHHTPMYFNCLF